MALPVIKNQVEEGLAYLITQWDNKPVVQGLLQSYLESIQELEVTYFQLLEERGIYSAIGAQLDVLGLIVGEPRDAKEDPKYREAILARTSVNNSDGTPEKILDVLASITQSPVPKLWEHYPASIHAYVDRNVVNQTAVTLEQVTAAGVSARLMFDDRGNSFRGAYLIAGSSDLVLENTDNLEVDDGVEVANLGVEATASVGFDNNSYFPHLGSLKLINPMCAVIDATGVSIAAGDLVLENNDFIGLDDGSTLAYQIKGEV